MCRLTESAPRTRKRWSPSTFLRPLPLPLGLPMSTTPSSRPLQSSLRRWPCVRRGGRSEGRREGSRPHLDGPCEQVAVVRQTGRERRSVVEGEPGLALGLLERRLEGVDVAPVLEDDVLLLGERVRPSWRQAGVRFESALVSERRQRAQRGVRTCGCWEGHWCVGGVSLSFEESRGLSGGKSQAEKALAQGNPLDNSAKPSSRVHLA